MVGFVADDERRSAVRLTLRQHLKEQRRAYLRAVLEETGGNVTKAAKIAGLNRTALHRAVVENKIRAPGRHAGNAAWRALA